MAYIYENEEEQNPQSADQTQPLGPESGIIGGAAAPSAEQKGSGQYTNLQGYLNQPNVGGFGEQFSNKVGESVAGAQEEQAKTGQAFKQAANQGTVKLDQPLLEAATSAPEQIVNDPSSLENFRKMQNAVYGGPESFSGNDEYYSPAYSATNKAVQETGQAQSQSGQKALLNKYYGAEAGRTGYSKGQQNLDSVLLGMNPGTRNALEAQKNRAAQAQSEFSNLENTLNQYAKERKGETEATRGQVSEALTGAQSSQQSKIQENYDKLMNQYNQERNRIQSRLGGGALSQDEFNKLGLSYGQKIYNLNLPEYYKPGAAPTLSSATGKEDYGRYDALSKLLNQQNTLFTDPNAVGTYKPESVYDFDINRFNTDAAGRQAAYEQELNRGQFTGPGAGKISEGISYGGGGEIGDAGPATQRNEGKPLSIADKIENIAYQKDQLFRGYRPEHRKYAEAEWERSGGAATERKYENMRDNLRNSYGYYNRLGRV